MKIEKIQSAGYKNSYAVGTHQQPSFGANVGEIIPDVVEITTKQMSRGEKLFYNFMEKLKPLQTELGGIITTAVGTGFVAPIFIGFNPFVKAKPGATKEEKEEVSNTKWYTAMRQPVSAFIAVALQGPITKWVDRVLDNNFNNPNSAKDFTILLDRSAINSESYLKRTIKKEMKEAATKENQSLFDTKKPFKKELERLVKERQTSQIEKVAGFAKDENGNIIEGLRQTGKIVINGREVPADILKDLLDEQTNEYIKELEKIKIGDTGIQYYTNRAMILMKNKDTLTSILEEGQKQPDLQEYLKEQVKTIENADVKKILQEIIDQKFPDMALNRAKNTIARIHAIENACNHKYSAETYRETMTTMNKDIDAIISKLEKLKLTENPTADKVKSIIEETTKILADGNIPHSVKIAYRETTSFGKPHEDVTKLVPMNIIKLLNEKIGRQHSLFAQITKIFSASFIALPICCTALNWVYPRFMELCFPKLAGVKKEQVTPKDGGNK